MTNSTIAYISAGEFVKFTDSPLPSRKPDPLTVKALQEIGISESNSYTLKGSLVVMGIYDNEGKLLQRDDLIGLSSKDEDIRRETYKRILKRTYSELIKAVPIEKATVAKVKHYFEVNGAGANPALKGARFFIWFARQAGYKTADVDFVPTSVEQEKTEKPKEVKGKKPKGHTVKVNTVHETDTAMPITPILGSKGGSYEEIYLNILLEKIRSSDGLPSVEVMQEVSKLIESQKRKNNSHHTDTPESSLERKDTEDA